MLTQLEKLLEFSPSSTKVPAAVLLAITNEANPRLLLTRRAQHLKSHAGEVSFPGGKREPLDTTNASVALRETHEETGISPDHVRLLGELPTQKSKSGFLVAPVVGLIQPNLELVPEAGEIERIFWGDMMHFNQDNIIPHHIRYKGMPIKTPSFVVDGEVVWGLTGRILVSLLNEVFDKNIKWPYVLLK